MSKVKKPCILGTSNEVKVIKEHLNEWPIVAFSHLARADWKTSNKPSFVQLEKNIAIFDRLDQRSKSSLAIDLLS